MHAPIAKPYTEQQRKLFHAADEDPEVAERHGMSQREAGQLANEADDYARRGKEKKATGFIDLSSIF